MDANGNGWLSDAIRCYDYCTNADTQVISNSWGVYESSAALQVRLFVRQYPATASAQAMQAGNHGAFATLLGLSHTAQHGECLQSEGRYQAAAEHAV